MWGEVTMYGEGVAALGFKGGTKEYYKQYRILHKEDNRVYQRAYFKLHKEKMLAQDKGCNARRKVEVLTRYSISGKPQCSQCGIEDVDVLTIDHINGGGNKHRHLTGEGTTFYGWLKKNKFPVGYQVLCANCNLKKEIVRRRNGRLF